jgi:hypothetical protein
VRIYFLRRSVGTKDGAGVQDGGFRRTGRAGGGRNLGEGGGLLGRFLGQSMAFESELEPDAN